MQVEHFMTRRVVTCAPDTPILTAARLMLDNHVSGLPVVDPSGRVVGVITETDLLREDGKSAQGSPWLQMVAGTDGLTGDPARLGGRRKGRGNHVARSDHGRIDRPDCACLPSSDATSHQAAAGNR